METIQEQFGGEKASRECPNCYSKKIWKNGTRKRDQEREFKCSNCGTRFSKKSYKQSATNNIRQLCAKSEAKKLDPQTEIKTVCVREGSLKKLSEQTQGLLIKFMAYLENENYDSNYLQLVRQIASSFTDKKGTHHNGADLLDPEQVKSVIAKRSRWSDSTKMLATYAYDAFCVMQKITWNRPKYRQQENQIQAPDLEDIQYLIASSQSKSMRAFLQTLLETYADPGEILQAIEWSDIRGNLLFINHPVKGHKTGKVELSQKLIWMINQLPKKSKWIFPNDYHVYQQNFRILRKKEAYLSQNPKLLKITFRSIRHYGGTFYAQQTNGNVIATQKALRHKSILSTMKYIDQTVQFKDDDYDVQTATTIEEIKNLGVAGFVKFDEINGVHFYRKPKRFRALE